MSDIVLEVKDLTKTYLRSRGSFKSPIEVPAVRSVSFQLKEGEVLCLVGESGCGKSTVGKMISDVIKPTSGQVLYRNQDLQLMSKKQREASALGIQLIHQDPFAALNPTRTIFQTLSAPLRIHGIASKKDVQVKLEQLLSSVGLAPAEEYLSKYPHQLSGGQRQRIVIARALTVNPQILVADEATSMVDVSLRVGILQTLMELARSLKLATVFITHDFGVARYIGYGQKIAVMYLGEIVEVGVTEEVIRRPHHPYTNMLLSAVPLPDPLKNRDRPRLLPASDEIPDVTHLPQGCSFANRCPFATDVCKSTRPVLQPSRMTEHQVACHHVDHVLEATESYRVWA